MLLLHQYGPRHVLHAAACVSYACTGDSGCSLLRDSGCSLLAEHQLPASEPLMESCSSAGGASSTGRLLLPCCLPTQVWLPPPSWLLLQEASDGPGWPPPPPARFAVFGAAGSTSADRLWAMGDGPCCCRGGSAVLFDADRGPCLAGDAGTPRAKAMSA